MFRGMVSLIDVRFRRLNHLLCSGLGNMHSGDGHSLPTITLIRELFVFAGGRLDSDVRTAVFRITVSYINHMLRSGLTTISIKP